MIDFLKNNYEILQVVNVGLQNSNLWELYVVGESENIKYRVQTITLPFLGFEIQTRKTGTKHFTSYESEGEFSITFLETTNFDTFNFLNKWKNQIYDPKERVFLSGGKGVKDLILIFQKDEVIRVIGPINRATPLTTKGFYFKRTLLKSMSPWDLNYTSTDPLIVTATFICDTIIPKEGESGFKGKTRSLIVEKARKL